VLVRFRRSRPNLFRFEDREAGKVRFLRNSSTRALPPPQTKAASAQQTATKVSGRIGDVFGDDQHSHTTFNRAKGRGAKQCTD